MAKDNLEVDSDVGAADAPWQSWDDVFNALRKRDGDNMPPWEQLLATPQPEDWGPWRQPTFRGDAIIGMHVNNVFTVHESDAGGGVTHLTVFANSRERPARPTWWEIQRIKNELAGAEKTAVEVYPPEDEVVD